MNSVDAAAVAAALPKDKKKLAEVIKQNMCIAEREMDIRMTRWLLAKQYLCGGIRNFDVYNPKTREVKGFSVDGEGKFEVEVQELMSQSNKVMGMFMAQDMRPAVHQVGMSLEGVRNRALADLITSAVIDEQELEKTHNVSGFLFHYYGFVGLQGRTDVSPVVGLNADLEVIPAWELYPFPAVGMDLTKLQGVIRQRMYPLAALKKRFPSAKLESKLKDMDAYEDTIGNPLDSTGVTDLAGKPTGMESVGSAAKTGDTGKQVVVKTRELWMMGPRGTASRMVVTSGDVVIQDISFDDVQTYMPIQTGRFIETGGFYGAGLFDLLFSTVREFEKMVKDLISNVKDQDRYPLVVLPSGMIKSQKATVNDGHGLKYMTYAIDPKLALSQQAIVRPTVISPVNSGDAPGKTAEFLKGLIDQTSPVKDLIEEKGRIDSLPALQFLDESSKQPTTVASSNYANMYGGVYRAVAASASLDLMLQNVPVPVTKLSLELAGAVIDFERGTVKFEAGINGLPELTRLRFGVKEQSPKSEALRKGEALDMVQRQLTDYDRFVLLMLEEGLNPAIWLKPEEAAYESVVFNILKLYGDGINPGEIVITPHMERPEFQLIVLNAFMAGGKMRVASVDVQDAFSDYREMLMRYMGVVLPEQVPEPLDQAIAQQASQDTLAQLQNSGALQGAPRQ